MTKLSLPTVIMITLAACTSPKITIVHSDFDPATQRQWTSIQGPMDIAGGARQTLLCPADLYGDMTERCYEASSPGTLQGFMNNGLGGMAQGAGLGMGLGLMKMPTTSSSITVVR